MPLPQERIYTMADIYALPEGTRTELIDNQIYYKAPFDIFLNGNECECYIPHILTLRQ